MFNVGDTIVYSVHGLCKIEDIVEKTISDVKRTYYVLHPLSQSGLTISTPVDNDKVVMLKPLNREQAEEIIDSFKDHGVDWINDSRKRIAEFNKIVKSGDRKEIARVANTLMRKKIELSKNKKKLYDQDKKMLTLIQDILFHELSHALNISRQEVEERINNYIKA